MNPDISSCQAIRLQQSSYTVINRQLLMSYQYGATCLISQWLQNFAVNQKVRKQADRWQLSHASQVGALLYA